MILRKPYAFIIKNFRIIHIIMFLCAVFISMKISSIYNFLTGYINNGTFDYQNNLVGNYVNLYMYLASLAIILLSLIVIALFNWKKIDFKYYIVIIVYYFVIFFGLVAMADFLKQVTTTTIDMRILKFYRDISLILLLPSFYFILTTFVTGIGFNIKKFDFSKDLKSLDASVEDNEEFEFVVGKDTYKYKRKLRRSFREFSYYVRENTFLFTIFATIATIIFIVFLYLSLYVNNRTYKESESFISNGLTYAVKSSYITNSDYRGKEISSKKIYLIVKLNIANSNTKDIEINTNNYRLVVEKETMLPIMNKGNYFEDLGTPYNNETILKNTSVEYLLIYEIDDKLFTGSYTFRIVNDVNILKGELAVEYNDTVIKPKYIEGIEVVGSYQIGKAATFEKSSLNKSNLTIKSSEIKEKFVTSYTYCISNNCYLGKDIIKANNVGGTQKTLIKLKIDYYIDNQSNIYKNALSAKKLFKNFGTISYLSKGIYKTFPLKDVTPNYMSDDTLYLEVPKEIEKSLEVILNIIVRDKKYVFILEN